MGQGGELNMSNKSIVVTGASKGIGRAIALQFAKHGFNVAVCARNQADLDNLKAELQAISPNSKILALGCDVRQKEEVLAFAKQVTDNFGTVDILVNNAGIFLPGEVHSEPEGTLEQLIETNLYSAYHITRALIGDMKARKSGSIFNVSSVAGVQAYSNGGSYSISKFAMQGFSKALREELKPHNIKVTTLVPGATLTSSWAGSGLPDERFMKAEDIAQAVWDVYSLSPNTVVEEILLRPVLGDI